MAEGQASDVAVILHHDESPGDAKASRPMRWLRTYDPGKDNAAMDKIDEIRKAKSSGVTLGVFYKYITSEIEDEANFASIGNTATR